MIIVGDTWAAGTGPVEQRGARFKRIARQVVSWRPPDGGFLREGSESPRSAAGIC